MDGSTIHDHDAATRTTTMMMIMMGLVLHPTHIHTHSTTIFKRAATTTTNAESRETFKFVYANSLLAIFHGQRRTLAGK